MQKDEKTLQITGFVGFFVFFAERKDNELFLLYSVIIRELIIPIFLLVTI
jgi:hypothetical protein